MYICLTKSVINLLEICSHWPITTLNINKYVLYIIDYIDKQ